MDGAAIRRAARLWLAEFGPDVFATFNFGYPIRPIDGDRSIKDLLNRIQHEAYGRNWSKRPPVARLVAVGCWEHVEKWSNPHCHVLVRGPELPVRTLLHQGREIWVSLQPRGQLDLGRVQSGHAVSSYVTKRVVSAEHQANLFVYGDDSLKPGSRRYRQTAMLD